MIEYWGLFWAALLAATLLPFYSEVVLLGLLAAGRDPILLWLFATAGNTLGACVNWGLGRFLMHYADRPWFPVREKDMARAQGWYQRWGVWSLLFGWLPIVGDPLTLIGGVMRVRFTLFCLLVGSGKGARYLVLLLSATAMGA